MAPGELAKMTDADIAARTVESPHQKVRWENARALARRREASHGGVDARMGTGFVTRKPRPAEQAAAVMPSPGQPQTAAPAAAPVAPAPVAAPAPAAPVAPKAAPAAPAAPKPWSMTGTFEGRTMSKQSPPVAPVAAPAPAVPAAGAFDQREAPRRFEGLRAQIKPQASMSSTAVAATPPPTSPPMQAPVPISPATRAVTPPPAPVAPAVPTVPATVPTPAAPAATMAPAPQARAVTPPSGPGDVGAWTEVGQPAQVADLKPTTTHPSGVMPHVPLMVGEAGG